MRGKVAVEGYRCLYSVNGKVGGNVRRSGGGSGGGSDGGFFAFFPGLLLLIKAAQDASVPLSRLASESRDKLLETSYQIYQQVRAYTNNKESFQDCSSFTSLENTCRITLPSVEFSAASFNLEDLADDSIFQTYSVSDLAGALPCLDESSPLNGHPFDNTASLAGESIFPSYSAFDLDAALPLVRCDFLTQVPNFEGVFGLAFLVVLVLGNFFSRGYSTAQEAVEETTEHICCQGACTCNTSASPSQDSSPPSASVESSSSPARYEKDQQVIYTSGGVSTVATVKVVHLDDTLVPYYTILVDGREKQTDDEHLSPFVGGSWMVSEVIVFIPLLISNINLTRSLLLIRTLLLRTVRHPMILRPLLKSL